MIDRRALLKLGLGALAFGCTSVEADPSRFRARPASSSPAKPGLRDLGLKRTALLYVPEKANGAFALVLHGATQNPERMMVRFQPPADEFGVTLLAPKSLDYTWDAIRGDFGTDVAFIDEALRAAFAACAVDPKHLAVSGFSDGATYAVALGRANGDLFTHVMAFSPGFIIRGVTTVGHPRFFLSHGTRDPILSIDSGSRLIARELRHENLSVKLREFDGEHRVPPEIAQEAYRWFVQ